MDMSQQGSEQSLQGVLGGSGMWLKYIAWCYFFNKEHKRKRNQILNT